MTGARRPVSRVSVGDALSPHAVAAAMAVGSPPGCSRAGAPRLVPGPARVDPDGSVRSGTAGTPDLAPNDAGRPLLPAWRGTCWRAIHTGPALFPLLVALYSVGDQLSAALLIARAGAASPSCLSPSASKATRRAWCPVSPGVVASAGLPDCSVDDRRGGQRADAEPRSRGRAGRTPRTPTAIGCT